MELSNNFNIYFKNIKEEINKASEEISRGGIKETTQNLIDSLDNFNFQETKKREISSIQTANYYMGQYDNVLSNMTNSIDSFKTEFMKKLNSSVNDGGQDSINLSLTSIKDNISSLLNTKLGTEKLFNINTELVIGDNARAPKTFSKEWIQFNGQDINDFLQGFIDGTNTNLDDLDKLNDFVNLKHSEIGARSNVLTNTENFYNTLKLNKEDSAKKMYKLEESIANFNDLNITYEALAKIAIKVSSLSLANYM